MAPRVMAVLAAVGLLAGAEWHPVHAARIDILGIGHDVRATVLESNGAKASTQPVLVRR